jgi:uncharacterized protein YfiM (DUF2279 family)
VTRWLGIGALWLGLTGGGQGEHHGGDSWFGRDKLLHLLAEATIQAATFEAIRATDHGHRSSVYGAWVMSAAAGVGKELYDRQTTGLFSRRDLTWDAIGAGAATVVLNQTRRRD